MSPVAGLAWVTVCALAVIAALGGLVMSASPLDPVISAAAGVRATEGRLTGMPHAPVAVPWRGPPTASNWRLLAAAGAAKERSDAAPDAANLHAYGVAALQAGSLDTAVQALEDAAAAEAQDATIHSDLAVAYLARSRHAGHAIDAPRAIEAAARAMRLNGRLADARFNYALALQRLNLRHEADQAWADYLGAFPDGGWAREAAQHRDALRRRPTPAPPSAGAVAHAALRAWATAALHDPTLPLPGLGAGRFHAAMAREVGRLEGRARRAWIAALRDAADAEAALAVPRYDEANRLAGRVLASAVGPESPIRLWALRIRLTTGFNAGDGTLPRQVAERLAEAAQRLGFVELESDARHRLGAFDFVAGRYEQAYQHYAAALEMRTALGDLRATMSSRLAAADAQRMLGRVVEAWEGYEQNLRAHAIDDAALQTSRLSGPALYALDSGLPAVALAFAREGESLAASHGNVGMQSYTLMLQSRALWRQGNQAGAVATIERARRFLDALTDASIRNRYLGELVAGEAEVLSTLAPARALPLMADSTRLMPANVRHRLPRMATLEARMHRRLGDVASARTALLRAVSLIDEQQRAIGQAEFLPSFIDSSWDAFAELVDLEAAAGRHPEALHWLDRGLDIRGRWDGELGAAPLADASRAGPVVAYLARPDGLWIWVVREGRVTARRVPVPRDLLTRRTARVAHLLTLDAPRALQEATATLARDIWWPIADLVAPGRVGTPSVALVLDPVLQQVPFPLLPWSADGHRQIVDVTASVLCPSLFACRGRNAGLTPEARVSALHAGHGGAGYGALPTARDESERIGRHHPGARVGPATEEALVEALHADDIVHFSGHAAPDERYPRRSHLLLATATGDTTAVPLHRLLSGPLHAQLVILSACRTSRAEARRGEGGIGVAGEFLRAGARHVLATQWDVKDDVAATAADGIHHALAAGAAPWDAVRHAQQRLRGVPGLAARDWAAYVAYVTVSTR